MGYRKLFLSFSLCVVLAMPLLGCATTAEVIVKFANDASPVLLEAYKNEGLAAVNETTCDQGPEACSTATQAAVAAVDTKWSPVWASWDRLSKARDAYAEGVQFNLSNLADLEHSLQLTYCDFLAILPTKYRTMLKASKIVSCS
jgi:hypothetical protein